MKLKFLLLLIGIFGFHTYFLKAQNNPPQQGSTTTEKSADEVIQDLLTAGRSDANKILKAYISPFAEGLGFAQLEGWYHTAKPLKKWAWNVQVITTAAIIPEDKKSFKISSLGLQNVELAPGSSDENPTVFGSNATNPNKLIIKGIVNPQPIALFSGTGVTDALPYAALQLSLGIFKNTELTMRGTPVRINFGTNGYLQPFGVGFKHDIKQWIPSIALSNFSLSVVGSYSILNIYTKLDISNLQNNPKDQTIDFKSKTWSAGIVTSKRFSLLTLFASIRYDNVQTATDLLGTYKIGNGAQEAIIENPYRENFSYNRFVINGGAKIKLGKFFAFLTATGGKYPGASLGFGLGGNE
jgi:hypothetical protein